jgi:hypothetical protein
MKDTAAHCDYRGNSRATFRRNLRRHHVNLWLKGKREQVCLQASMFPAALGDVIIDQKKTKR